MPEEIRSNEELATMIERAANHIYHEASIDEAVAFLKESFNRRNAILVPDLSANVYDLHMRRCTEHMLSFVHRMFATRGIYDPYLSDLLLLQGGPGSNKERAGLALDDFIFAAVSYRVLAAERQSWWSEQRLQVLWETSEYWLREVQRLLPEVSHGGKEEKCWSMLLRLRNMIAMQLPPWFPSTTQSHS